MDFEIYNSLNNDYILIILLSEKRTIPERVKICAKNKKFLRSLREQIPKEFSVLLC